MKRKSTKEAYAEIETEHLGYLSLQDTFNQDIDVNVMENLYRLMVHYIIGLRR